MPILIMALALSGLMEILKIYSSLSFVRVRMNKTKQNQYDPSQLLTFKNINQILKFLKEIPEEYVRLLGYVDENNIIQRFELKDLKKLRSTKK